MQAAPAIHRAQFPVTPPHTTFAGARQAICIAIIAFQAVPTEPAQALTVPGTRLDTAGAGKQFTLNPFGQGARMLVAAMPVVPLVAAMPIVMAQVATITGHPILVVLGVGNGRAQDGQCGDTCDNLGRVFSVGAGRRGAQAGDRHGGGHDECNELAMHGSFPFVRLIQGRTRVAKPMTQPVPRAPRQAITPPCYPITGHNLHRSAPRILNSHAVSAQLDPMKQKILSLTLVSALALALPAMAQAAGMAEYKAKRDKPLELHYDVAQISGSCTIANARSQLADRLSRQGLTLLKVLSVSEQ